jgi:hypothetical protein
MDRAMMRLFLVEKNGQRKIDLGLFKFNDEANCISAARRKHRFLSKMETNGFEFKGETEPGPLRHPKRVVPQVEQLSIVGA